MSRGTQYVSVDDIIGNVTSLVGDEDMKVRPRGTYVQHVSDALVELAYDTFFDVRHFEAPLTSLVIDLPADYCNIRHVYLFDGNVCDFASAINVHYKMGFVRHGEGNGYFAENRWRNNDPVMENAGPAGAPGGLKYCNTQNGKLMLSSSCMGAAQNVYVEYCGLGQDFSQEPIIPMFLKKAVEDYVAVEVLRYRVAEEYNSWIGAFNIAREAKEGRRNPPFDGTWHRAKKRVQEIDSKLRDDMSRYLSTYGYGR